MGNLSLVSIWICCLCFLNVTAGYYCPPGFEIVNGRCYFFSESIYKTLSWDNARTQCQKYSTSTQKFDLAIFFRYTFDEFVAFEDYMAYKGYVNTFHVGARNVEFIDEYWAWMDGTPLPLNHPLWNCNYPKTTSSAYSCGAFFFLPEPTSPDATFRPGLREAKCTDGFYYICEEIPSYVVLLDNFK